MGHKESNQTNKQILDAQKNRLIETVLLSTHNICLGWEIRKLIFCYTLLTKVLLPKKVHSCQSLYCSHME